ncbi:PREDICTED: hematopoietic SH2 domain-containing protein [Miniopterus natalensis]|uniref:hematopoietic SH2 domain-containing protein n=1 Tax=Miniopterus natalensis TaxID=291302 RepID=UPI0007A6DC41|nr:PREDICTED: hematopoietic SH2 domain-containing protein [Miniopterus natalensis]
MTEARKLPPPLPPRLDWFVHTQVGQLAQGEVPSWFHGAISRQDAENLLESQPLGSFLIRVSHSHVGYTLSYKAQNCYRHFMVKLLDNGSLIIPGEERAHASLDALVTFHQQQPIRPHGELLKQPCPQEDPANVDYEDLFLYYHTLAEEAASLPPGPSEHQKPSSHPVAARKEASAKLVLLHRGKERKSSAEMNRVPTGEAASSCPPKAPLEEACQKLWRNLKTLPEAGKRVQQQLKSHLATVSLPSLRDSERSEVTHGSTRADDAAWDTNVYTDPFVAVSLSGPSQPQAPKDRDNSSKKASRSVSWSEVTPRTRGWHQAVVRALSSQVSKLEQRDLAEEPPEDWLPEEYRPPPPFAPGYC